MPGENIEVVQRVMEAWERGRRVPADLLDDEVEWVNPSVAIEAGTRRGAGGFDSAEANFAAAFDSVRFALEEVVDLGDRVLVLTQSTFRGRGSDVEVRRPLGFLWTLRDGKVVRFQWFNDHETAREACAARDDER